MPISFACSTGSTCNEIYTSALLCIPVDSVEGTSLQAEDASLTADASPYLQIRTASFTGQQSLAIELVALIAASPRHRGTAEVPLWRHATNRRILH